VADVTRSGLLFGLGFRHCDGGPRCWCWRAGAAAGGFAVLTAIICLPILFAGRGLSLLDTIDGRVHELRLRLGVLPSRVRKVLLQTSPSRACRFAVALLIGTVELLGGGWPRSSA